MTNSKTATASKAPIPVNVEAGKKYFYCTCGDSSKQPFCDGAHKDVEGFSPMMLEFEENKTVYFCSCKKTDNQFACDGTHNSLN